MKKKIISNTILFIIILSYIFLFKFAFGDENILIAVMSITGLLMFMGSDLTAEPIRNTAKMIIFYVLIGIGTFIAANNIWIAIPVNFIIIFMISYTFGHVFKAPMYIPFSLLYLFLLAYPVPLNQMPLRILALVVGAVCIMLPQFIINKNKIKKSSDKIFLSIFKLLHQKIDLILEGKSYTEINTQIYELLKNLKNIIYDKKEKKFYISDEGQASLDMLVSIENLSCAINDCKNNKELLLQIKEFLSLLEKNDASISNFTTKLIKSYDDCTDENTIKTLTSILSLDLELKNINEKKHISAKNIKRNLKSDIYGLKNIKFNSIKTTYAVRLAIEVVIACFIMEYFHLEQGRWIMYTVLSLTTPMLETTKSKAVDRIIATIVGAIIIAISFSIFSNTIIRSVIVMGAGYANMYCNSYRAKMMTVTTSAIGGAALVGGFVVDGKFIAATPVVLSFERVIFILIGAVIAIIINSFLFRYDVDKANNHLKNISNDLVIDLLKNMPKLTNDDRLKDYINNVYLLNAQVVQTINANLLIKNKTQSNNLSENFISAKEEIIADVYELQNLINNISSEDTKIINKLILELKENKNKSLESISAIRNTYFKDANMNNKIIYNLILNIEKSFLSLTNDKLALN